jgi:hypothetical protein
MAQVDIIRNGIIDKLLAISDQDYLLALQRLINSSKVEENKITLTKEQKESARKGYENKLMSGLTKAQREQLLKHPDLVKKLTN